MIQQARDKVRSILKLILNILLRIVLPYRFWERS